MGDPTALDPRLYTTEGGTDPRERRMRGYAVHGNTPFDVPFISEVAPGLWLGGCENGLVLPLFFSNLVSLYPWERYAVRQELTTRLEVRQYDSEPDEARLEALSAWVNLCRATGPTLVHCQAGLNRSSLVAALALVRAGEVTSRDAIDLLRARRSPAVLCNVKMETWLLDREV